MALMQMNGRDILQHRFELYQSMARTLLDTWNRESGRKTFSGEELSLVEDVLGRFAERLQSDDGLLTGSDIEMISNQAFVAFFKQPLHEIKNQSVAELIEALRRSSGLFAEVGDDLYCNVNCASLLGHKPSEMRSFSSNSFRVLRESIR
jgi:hypothetical protein